MHYHPATRCDLFGVIRLVLFISRERRASPFKVIHSIRGTRCDGLSRTRSMPPRSPLPQHFSAQTIKHVATKRSHSDIALHCLQFVHLSPHRCLIDQRYDPVVVQHYDPNCSRLSIVIIYTVVIQSYNPHRSRSTLQFTLSSHSPL